MKACMFCANTRIFNIHNDYGNNNHTIKDDLFEVFGHQIEGHLREDDAICNLCMNIMDSFAKLKRRFLPMIIRSERWYVEDRKPLKLGRKWDVFASQSFEDDSDVSLQSRTPTPSNLVTCNRVVPYDSRRELQIAEIERHRSLSRGSAISYTRSEADSEIAAVFTRKNGKRKRRGHNWSRVKKGRYSQMSTRSRNSSKAPSWKSSRSRSNSVLSTDSYEPFDAGNYNAPTDFGTAMTFTITNNEIRAISRQEEEDVRVLHQCSEPGCSYVCDDIDLMAKHKIAKHGQFDLFWCNCGKKYTTRGDLEVHKRTHKELYEEYFNCDVCRQRFHNEFDLLKHWQVHVNNSVLCKFCDQRFVNKTVLKKHEKNVHKRNIPSRIDYNDKNAERSESKNSHYEVRILVQNDSENERSVL